jgi:hypothetical protein
MNFKVTEFYLATFPENKCIRVVDFFGCRPV